MWWLQQMGWMNGACCVCCSLQAKHAVSCACTVGFFGKVVNPTTGLEADVLSSSSAAPTHAHFRKLLQLP